MLWDVSRIAPWTGAVCLGFSPARVSQLCALYCTHDHMCRADNSDDRVKLPSDPTRTVKGVDVLPFVMSPLMGPEEYDMDVSTSSVVMSSSDGQEMDKLPATLQFLGTEKKREQDTVLRMMCVEILLLLSTSKS